ncbi:hypothetical protein BX070DRAFT_235031 [Coemansia spiralis]|nr:hypothetical protein BX070DRAFT_235031 [Coemansia spiralis]
MSRLPRGPAAATPAGTIGGSIRPPTSGLTVPRSLGGNFHSDMPTTPALTQRIHSGSRRATLTTATFSPPNVDGNATVARSSGIAGPAARMFGRTVSPSLPGTPGDYAQYAVTKSSGLSTIREPSRTNGLSGKHAKSPTTEPLNLRKSSNAGISTDNSLAVDSSGSSNDLFTMMRPEHELPKVNGAALAQTGHVSDMLRPGSVAGLCCGEPVLIPTEGIRGTLRYLGPIDGKQGAWAGIELDEVGKGKNDGTVAGKVYFSCPPNTGLFLAPSKVQPVFQKHGSTASPPEAEPVASVSAVVATAQPSQRTGASASKPASGNMGGRSAASSDPHRTQRRQPGRARIASEAQPRLATPDIPANASRMRLPPATLSRGTSRTRPISTTESIASNRTSSPLLSRPSSRSLASGVNTDKSLLSTSPSKASTLLRTQPFSGTQDKDLLQKLSNAAMPRTAASPTVHQSDSSAGTVSGVVSRTRAVASAESIDRLQRQVDMLEAENRMLRLKNDQDKAHLTAGQMLARDLAIANGTTSPQTPRSSADLVNRLASHTMSNISSQGGTDASSSQQLKEVRDILDRERIAAKTTIEKLESEISALKISTANEIITNDAEEKHDTAVETKDVSIEFGPLQISEPQTAFKQIESDHASEILSVKNAYSELSQAFEEKVTETEMLKAQLESKTEEAASLNNRVEHNTIELEKMAEMYQSLLKEWESKHANGAHEDPELASTSGKQLEKLQREIADSESTKIQLSSELEVTKNSLSATENQLANVRQTLKDMEQKVSEYSNIYSLAAKYHNRLYQIVIRMAEHCSSGDGEFDGHSIDDIPTELAGIETSQEMESKIFNSANDYLSCLIKKADSASRYIEVSRGTNSNNGQASGQEVELPDTTHMLSQSPSDTLSESDEHNSTLQLQYLQMRVEELEVANYNLLEQRNSLLEDCEKFVDQLKIVEQESNRLMEDIEQLSVQNQKLSDDLRVASMQNSTVSLDIASLDSRFTGEILADNEGGVDVAIDAGSGADTAESAKQVQRDTTGEVGDLRRRHEREVAALQSRLADLELRKNSEIDKLQDEIGTLGNLVEDGIFREDELNKRIAYLEERERLQRSNSLSAATHASSNSTNVSFVNSASAEIQNGSGRPLNSVHNNVRKAEADLTDEETMYCDICDAASHSIADCPEITSTPINVFKQEASIDSSRPYCDNCEAFDGHWTDECPHGDEMF